MSLKAQQNRQFIVLLTGDININHPSLKHHGQNIVVANEHNDILLLIATAQFNLILLDLTENRSELITRIKEPLCINNKTPIIAITDADIDCSFHLPSQREDQCPMVFDDWLIRPVTEEQLSEIIDIWQTKALVLSYIQIIMTRTKNNRQLTLTIFEKLFEELPLQIIQIKDALQNEQYNLAQEITHKLNGSVSFCGLIDIQQSANTLEGCLLSNNYASTRQYFLILQQCTLDFTRHQAAILANFEKH